MSDPAKYRSREEVQKMREEQDPIEYIKAQLLNKKIFNDETLRKIDNDIRLEISELAEKATEAEFSTEEELYNNVLSV
jgi:pyruvate dehydrogenase E1 component alpha subunit